MKKSKGISTFISIFIILIISLGVGFVIQKSTDLGNLNGSNFKFPLKEKSEEKDISDDNKKIIEEEEDSLPTYKVAIIIDDIGNNLETDKKLSEIEEDLTLAILPNRGATLSSAKYLSSFNNFQLLLHLPLEPIDSKDAEKDMIMTSMGKVQMENQIKDYLKELNQYIVGVNNHKGSKFTSNYSSMKTLLEVLKENNLFFVDSFTYKDSIAFDVAKEINIRTAKRDIFLDNSDNKKDIKEKLDQTIELAKEKGEAIAIGHSRPNTISVLKKELKSYDNIEFIKISYLF